VRAAIAAALGDFKGDEGAFSTETKLVIYGGIGAGHNAVALKMPLSHRSNENWMSQIIADVGSAESSHDRGLRGHSD
jgi:hypothetical protein